MDAPRLVLILVAGVLGTAAAGHALLYKRDPRASWGWIAVCLIFPIAGALLYFLFGINRIRTRARRLDTPVGIGHEGSVQIPFVEHVATNDQVPAPFTELARLARAVTGRPLVANNRIRPLHNGEQAFPAMLEAIDRAEHHVYLATYIFETNDTGQRFIDALGRAWQRGVDVRVIIDGVGEWYSRPRAGTKLGEIGVPVARFLPPNLWPPSVNINLRNHRKILVIDGQMAFTGGMNIGDRHLAANEGNPDRVVDIHFEATGPIAKQIEEVFLADWQYLTGEETALSETPDRREGNGLCRAIMEGPNEDLNQLNLTLAGAVAAAHQSVMIMTPYFLPPRELIAALQSAALRGVSVTVILPEHNNLAVVHWASRNMLWELLEWGIAVYYQPPPFVHTKLFLVDEQYVQLGSANLDTRSLRLNFELVTEVYDAELARDLSDHCAAVRTRSRSVTLEEIDNRPLPVRIRDAVCWLFSPYL